MTKLFIILNQNVSYIAPAPNTSSGHVLTEDIF